MNERDCEYAAEYLQRSVFPYFATKIGQLALAESPLASSQYQKGFQLMFPVDGAETSKKVLAQACSGLGQIGMINFPEGRDNVWLGRQLGTPGDLGMSKRLGPPWIVVLTSSSEVTLPDEALAYGVFECLTMHDSSAAMEGSDFDPSGEEYDIMAAGGELAGFMKRIAESLAETDTAADLVLAPMAAYSSAEPSGRASMVLIHGIGHLFAAIKVMKRLFTDVASIKSLGLVHLASPLRSKGAEWQGKYGIVAVKS